MQTQRTVYSKILGSAATTLVIALVGSGCGGSSSKEIVTQPGNSPGASSGGNNPNAWCAAWNCVSGPTGTGSGGTGTGGTGTGSTGSTANLPPLAYSFQIAGAGSTTYQTSYTTSNISTDSILKIRVTAGPAGQLSAPGVSYSNYQASYSCITYRITVLGQSVVVGPLRTGSSIYNVTCPNAPTSQVIDLSSRLTPGHGAIRIKVDSPSYDYYCQWAMKGYIYGTVANYCQTLYGVYKNHTVTGSLSIQVNGTTDP